MKDILQVTATTSVKVEAGNLPKGLTDRIASIFDKAVPFVERFLESELKKAEMPTETEK